MLEKVLTKLGLRSWRNVNLLKHLQKLRCKDNRRRNLGVALI